MEKKENKEAESSNWVKINLKEIGYEDALNKWKQRMEELSAIKNELRSKGIDLDVFLESAKKLGEHVRGLAQDVDQSRCEHCHQPLDGEDNESGDLILRAQEIVEKVTKSVTNALDPPQPMINLVAIGEI